MSHPSLPIYVDLDDVLAETGQAIVQLVNAHFGRSATLETLHAFDLKESFQLSQAEWEELFHLIHRPDTLLAMEPVPGASDTLNRWAAQGYEIAIVTGRPLAAKEATLAWLAQHAMPYDSFTLVDKYGRESDRSQTIDLDELSHRHYAMAVEDSPAMAVFLAKNMGLNVILMDRPWNRNAESHPAIRRIGHWAELDGWPPG